MAMSKLPGGVEDLTFGMGTEQQVRKGAVYVITQIHAGFIPYSSTQSTAQKIDQMENQYSGVKSDLDKHKADYDNPHQITPEDVGAAPLVHTHTISAVDGLQDELDDKSDIGHTHTISAVDGLQTELDSKMDDGDAFLKTEHIIASVGGADAGKPIVLDNAGKLDPSIAGSGLIFVAMFTPTAGTEYPDNTGYSHGSYWGIEGVDDTLGYTFTGGDLAGATVFNGDAMVVGTDAWGYMNIGIDPGIYYKVDGTLAISAPFAGGGQLISNITDGVVATDGATVGQLTTGLAEKYAIVAGAVAGNVPTFGADILVDSGVLLADLALDADVVTKLPIDGSVAMTGALDVPAGASGTEVPQAQETALLAEDNNFTGGVRLDGHYISPFAFRNKFINGGFDIWQRGESFSSTDGAHTYTADRWNVSGTDLTTTNDIPTAEQGNIIRLGSDTPDGIYSLKQAVELKDMYEYSVGKVYTVSGWVWTDAIGDITYNVVFRDLIDSVANEVEVVPIDTVLLANVDGWQKFKATFTIPTAQASTSTQILVIIRPPDVTTIFKAAQLQLEEGSVATPFEQRPVAVEMLMCQRYYQRHYASSAYKYGDGSSGVFEGAALNGAPIMRRGSPTFNDIDLVYDNCSFSDAIGRMTMGQFQLRVTSLTVGTYRAYGNYELDGEL